MSNPESLQRLRSARGHLDGVIRMLEDDRYCIDVLHQLGAVQAALDRAAQAIVDGHLRTCVADAYAEGRIDDVADELMGAVFGARRPSSQ
ncbi:MAG: metal-sensitive transcriptional regulator [Acidimicrobiia bacterium]